METFKVVWNESMLNRFKNCGIKEQMASHSQDKLNYLFELTIAPTDKRRKLSEVARDIANYEIMQLFGSGSFQWFKIEEVK